MTAHQDLELKLVFPRDKVPPIEANYEPWEFFKKSEDSDITIQIYESEYDALESEASATYEVHKRIIRQAPEIFRILEEFPTSPTLQFHGEAPHIFEPILAYMYLHDFLYLCHNYSNFDCIKKIEDQVDNTKITIHDSAYRYRMLYYTDLYHLANRLGLESLCNLLVERYIAVYDVPSPRLSLKYSSQDPDYKYSPFTLYSMSDLVKNWYIDRIYNKAVSPMIPGEKGNLRWRVIEGIIARSEILESFEFQLEDFEGFFKDIIKGLEYACAAVDPMELRDSPLHTQYLELMEWKRRTEGRREQVLESFQAELKTRNLSDSIGKLSFHAEDKENKRDGHLDYHGGGYDEDDEEEDYYDKEL
ncbi:hypothetical protein H072_11217 [Dactylellina haptotyla CBS 200.50]|uniref:BTB domain-containing protein n=1 Tax=Dactylellina haptotyla (strain CBS 200.50) TaxID=1284197 RepID=S7ZXC8_DACHA|nr:hypothetical protein H072_11217 [Dactylellina haptotyla CBS 200.50]